MDYLLLLRGINVGGNHKVSMATLRIQLTMAGFSDVKSYINSGNLFLRSNFTSHDTWVKVEQVLVTNYDFKIEFQLLTHEIVASTLKAAPDWWGADNTWRHNVLFKLKDYRDMFDTLVQEKITDDFDRCLITPAAIFWSSPQKEHFSSSFYAKMLREPFYPYVSIRNETTTRKLANMMASRNL